MKLHLVTTNESGFNYLNYLSAMSALLHNDTVLWYEDKYKNNRWWDLIEKMAKKSSNLEFRKLDPFSGFTIDQTQDDQVGRLDILYLVPFHERNSIYDALVNHDVFGQKGDGEFKHKGATLIRVFLPEGKESSDFITPEWVSANDTLLSALIKRAFLERVWNPYGKR